MEKPSADDQFDDFETGKPPPPHKHSLEILRDAVAWFDHTRPMSLGGAEPPPKWVADARSVLPPL